MTHPADKPVQPGDEGSDTCCAVLRLLHRRPDGLALKDIASILQAEVHDARLALIGLSERSRVRSVGKDTGARWYTTPHSVRARAMHP